ncbi:protein-signal peptide and transmembrane prediction [Alienimonas californiensis]|uniref:Isochorismatase family protein n=1 Tax=Alienimonas californiensis TaxID=2527989 RepID=A0A517PE20_9PLAN|nr:protein-signal peptide and transmembrane prediction [Alienimonas californiensis]QDT17617.1 Isochorismatase family protein [Alienimonas californiensis]
MSLALAAALLSAAVLAPAEPLVLHARAQQRPEEGGGYRTAESSLRWNPTETAVVVCDMWDRHTCPSAERRVAEMAPRMNDVLVALRRRGVLIIHCPSDTMKFYEGTPGRTLAQQAPKVETEIPLERWCHLKEYREPPLPIDDSDGGCDCCPDRQVGPPWPWTRQIAALQIEPGDAITDSAEAFYLMKQRSIRNVIVMGVHANMCVLGRPFAIRQLTLQGQNVVLMRDLTDAMYNPARSPYVGHHDGTRLVVQHIERYWCPTIVSGDVLGDGRFRFADDDAAAD